MINDPYTRPALNNGCFTAILIVGILVLTLSGLCTGLFAVSSLIGPDPYGFWQLALMIGTPIMVASALFAWIGWRGRKRHKQREARLADIAEGKDETFK